MSILPRDLILLYFSIPKKNIDILSSIQQKFFLQIYLSLPETNKLAVIALKSRGIWFFSFSRKRYDNRNNRCEFKELDRSARNSRRSFCEALVAAQTMTAHLIPLISRFIKISCQEWKTDEVERNRGRGLIKAKQAAESADRENICQRNNYGSGTWRATRSSPTKDTRVHSILVSGIEKDIRNAKCLGSKSCFVKISPCIK